MYRYALKTELFLTSYDMCASESHSTSSHWTRCQEISFRVLCPVVLLNNGWFLFLICFCLFLMLHLISSHHPAWNVIAMTCTFVTSLNAVTDEWLHVCYAVVCCTFSPQITVITDIDLIAYTVFRDGHIPNLAIQIQPEFHSSVKYGSVQIYLTLDWITATLFSHFSMQNIPWQCMMKSYELSHYPSPSASVVSHWVITAESVLVGNKNWE